MTALYGINSLAPLPPNEPRDANRTTSYRSVHGTVVNPENAHNWTLRSDRECCGSVEMPAYIPAPRLCFPPVQHMPGAMHPQSSPGEFFPATVKTDARELIPTRQTNSLHQPDTPKSPPPFKQRDHVSTLGLYDGKLDSAASGGCHYSRERWEVASDAPFVQQTSLFFPSMEFSSGIIDGQTLLEMMEGNGRTVDDFGRSLREPLGPFVQPLHPPNEFPPSISVDGSMFSDDLGYSSNVGRYDLDVQW
jgi:hypothetical protein